jgi:hypothetical protein
MHINLTTMHSNCENIDRKKFWGWTTIGIYSISGIDICSDKANTKIRKKTAQIHINLTTIHSYDENMDRKQLWDYNGKRNLKP